MKIEESWGFAISKIGQEMDRCFSRQLEAVGLKYRDSRYYGVLLAVYNYPQLTQLKIGEKLSIDRTSIGQLIDELERKGLVHREKNPEDRRQNVLTLTLEGEGLVKNMWPKLKAAEQQVIRDLPDSQKTIILEIAEQIKENNHDKTGITRNLP